VSNRTFLLSLANPFEELPPETPVSPVCAASYMIPLAWLSLFTSNDIKVRTVTSEENEPIQYEILSCSKSTALERSKAQWAKIEMVLNTGQETYSKFAKFLLSLPGEFLAVETGELWMMYDPNGFKKDLESWLATLSSDPFGKSGLFRLKKKLSPKWSSLLAQADIHLDPQRNIEPSSIVGYSWEQPVPWE